MSIFVGPNAPRPPFHRGGVGLVLSGGAARGAYEAGVLRFVICELSRRLGRGTWPDVVSGTSVGALNGVFAAARSFAAFARLTRTWQELAVHDIYRFTVRRALIDILRPRSGESFALLDPTPFFSLIQSSFPGRELREAIDSEKTGAFLVAATEVHTGFNALFCDSRHLSPLATQPGTRVYHTQINGEHCRASAAIPFVFPAVEIRGSFHVDGGLRQNTPLRPLLSTGISRALVIGVKQDREEEAKQNNLSPTSNPSLLFLAGKMMNALMLDPVERDFWSAEYRNHVVQWAERHFPGFADAANRELGLREVDILHIRPSQDLGRMASAIYKARPPRTSRQNRFLLDQVLAFTGDLEADFLSYLYFDREYTGALEALGFEDARRSEEHLARLFAAS
jgi:NTE family protein